MKASLLRVLLLASAVVFARASVEAQCSVTELLSQVPVAQERYGQQLDLCGDTLVVGVPRFAFSTYPTLGAVDFFERDGSGWTHVDRLLPSFFGGFHYGRSVSIDGTRVAVGAPYIDQIGGVFILEKTPVGWREVDLILQHDPVFLDTFGDTVALDGDRLAVVSRLDNDAGGNFGSVYVYEKTANGWEFQEELLASDQVNLVVGFQVALALDGDTILRGHPRAGDFGEDSGAVYVYDLSPTGWVESTKLVPPDGEAFGEFGASLALDGDVAVIGAPGADVNHTNNGAAYVYERTASGWNIVQKLSSDSPWDRYGWSVDIDGDTIVVGGPYDDLIAPASGGVLVFHRKATGWVRAERLHSPHTEIFNGVGTVVSVSGDQIATSSPSEMIGEDSGAGAVFVFEVAGFAQEYCVCMDDGPCGNGDLLGGCANSTLRGARLAACGSASVVTDDLVMGVTEVPPGQFGLVYMGADPIALPFGDGFRCAGGATFRFDVRTASANGMLVEGPGIVAFSQANFGVAGAIVAGDTWYFQGWYRDPASPCGGGFNLSTALAVLFAP